VIKRLLLFATLMIPLTVTACQTWAPTERIEVASIPDQTYDVTAYRGNKPLSYAVLFAKLDQGIPVIMYHTMFVKRIGQDSPGQWIERFNERTRGHKTLAISDKAGDVRGYLMISNFLYYEIYERPAGERIVVQIGRPGLDPVLEPGR